MPSNLEQATTDPSICWELLDTHRQVSCGVTVPFSWVLVHKVLLCPPRVYFPVLCKFWQLYGGVNGNLLQEDLCHTHTQSPCPCSRPLLTCTSTGDAHIVLSQSLWGPWVLVHTRFVWTLWVSLAGMRIDSKHKFAPPSILLGLLLCPWTWGVSSQPLQCLPSYWGFSDLGHWVSPHSWYSEAQVLLLTLDVGRSSRSLATPVPHSWH